MRRFYGFLVLVVSLLLVVFSNIQPQVSELTSGLEYGGGYETVYKVDFKDSQKELSEIGDIIVQRIEDAGVENAQVEIEQDDLGSENYVRIRMNANSEENLDYVLRSVEATGQITASTIINHGNEDFVYEIVDPFEIKSAEVNWNGAQPHVEVKVKDPKEFKEFIEICNTAYENFKQEYGSGEDEESSLSGVMVLWLDKTETDSYIEAYTNEGDVSKQQIRDKVLAIVPTDNFNYVEDVNGETDESTLLISYYSFEQVAMVGESAHTIERIINYGQEDYELTRLYTQHIPATEGQDYDHIIMWGILSVTALLLVVYVIKYGLAGLGAWTGLAVSLLVQVLLFNFFEYTFTTMVGLGFIATLVANASYVFTYMDRFKDELLKGKSAIKANQEAAKLSFVNVFDVAFIGLFVAIISIFAVSSQVKLLPTTLILGLLTALIFNRLLTSFSMWWLTNNKVALNNKKIFMVNDKDVPDILKLEPQRKFNAMHNFDCKKHGKRSALIASIVTVVCGLLIAVFAIIPSTPVFNDSNESKTYSRIEISSEIIESRYIFETTEEVKSFFDNNYPSYEIEDIDINVESNVVIPGKENLVDVVYVSVKFANTIDPSTFNNEVFVGQLEALDHSENPSAVLTTCNSSSVDYLLGSAIAIISLFAGLTFLFVLIRFGYTYGLASLSTIIPAAAVSFGFFAASRIEISALSLTGIAAGLLIVSIAQLPLFERMKRLKRESKVRINTYEQREEIALNGVKSSMITVVSILSTGLVATIVIALFSPFTPAVLSTYGAMALSILVGGLLSLFLLVPVYLFLEKNVRLKISINTEKRNKKRMEKAKAKNRNSGAEAREAIIPGIND